jgi:hypothetical protein
MIFEPQVDMMIPPPKPFNASMPAMLKITRYVVKAALIGTTTYELGRIY